MFRSEDGWIESYREKNAFWMHDGNPKRPHALLTSGLHSNGFFNSKPVIADTLLMYASVADLLQSFERQGGDFREVQVVVGPQTGATKMAQAARRLVNAVTDLECFCASPEKGEQEGRKMMVFIEDEIRIVFQRRSLLCEDVLTTGGSVELTTQAIERADGLVLPFVLTLVNRSGLTEVGGRKIISLINRHMPTWTPEECPLCPQGSEAIRPKDPVENLAGEKNWDRLNGDY